MPILNFQHIILSPHLDDAPLSCGGAIYQWAAAGETVLVLTFMTGDPPAGPLSPFAESLHDAWDVPAQEAFMLRRREERAAMERLGAELKLLNYPDCIYRGEDDDFFYTSNEELFGPIHPADAPLAETLTRELAALGPPAPEATVYAPLAIGNHIDHQLLRQAAESWRGRDLLYYEDYPYTQRENADALEAQRLGSQFEMQPTQSLLVLLTEQALQAKIEAVRCYASQMGVLFGNSEQIEIDLPAFARHTAGGVGWAERFWRVP
jgi:LmbE family N-acetylglucosaminyl deacetylase